MTKTEEHTEWRLSSEPWASMFRQLSNLANEVDQKKNWPSQSMDCCRRAGVFRWFIPRQYGGLQWTDLEVLNGFLTLSQSCLTTAFILTQWHAACRRILSCSNVALRERIAPKLTSGECFATVGISHLTTSRQHGLQPALRAIRTSGGYRLEGFSPWVTGAANADLLVLGATLEDNMQVLVAVPTNQPGVVVQQRQPLVALTASCTGQVDFEGLFVSDQEVLAGPVANVMTGPSSGGGSVGGLHTSALAVGLASSAVEYIAEQSVRRTSLVPIVEKLQIDLLEQRRVLEQLTLGQSTWTAGELRRQANSLVLRATQAALQTAKGAGFIEGHPAGRWAREALFFLVWSCPQAVMEANLCDLVGLEAAL